MITKSYKHNENRQNIGVLLERITGKGVGAVLVRGASAAFVVQVIGAGISLLAQIFIARVLGANSYGEYIYVITWLNILLLLGKIGFDQSTLRFVASYRGLEKWGLLRGFLRRSQQLSLLFSLATSFIAICITWLLKNQIENKLIIVFFLAYLILNVR